MEVEWGRFVQPDGRNCRQIQLSGQPSWSEFERVALSLQVGLSGTWMQKIDGADERYWDLFARGGRLTLHLQHYLGITLYPTSGADAESEAIDLLEQAYTLLASQASR
jgi:hypothetical protein